MIKYKPGDGVTSTPKAKPQPVTYKPPTTPTVSAVRQQETNSPQVQAQQPQNQQQPNFLSWLLSQVAPMGGIGTPNQNVQRVQNQAIQNAQIPQAVAQGAANWRGPGNSMAGTYLPTAQQLSNHNPSNYPAYNYRERASQVAAENIKNAARAGTLSAGIDPLGGGYQTANQAQNGNNMTQGAGVQQTEKPDPWGIKDIINHNPTERDAAYRTKGYVAMDANGNYLETYEDGAPVVHGYYRWGGQYYPVFGGWKQDDFGRWISPKMQQKRSAVSWNGGGGGGEGNTYNPSTDYGDAWWLGNINWSI